MHLFKKILKILGFIVLGVIVLLIIASIFIGPIAKNYLEDEINQADQGQYEAQIDNVNVSIVLGNFVVEGLRIQTDTVVARENETPVITLDAGEISVRGLSWLQFLLTDKLQINTVSFLDLELEAKVRTVDDEEEPDEDAGPFRWEDLDIYPMVKDQVDRIRLNDLNFSNLDLTLINVETVDTLTFVAEEFNVSSDDILIDADRVFTDARAFYASAIDIQGKDVEVNRIGDPQFNLQLGLIEFATRESDFGMLSKNLQFFKHGEDKEDTVIFAGYTEFNLTDLDLNTVQEDSLAKIGTVFLNDLLVINNLPLDEEEVERAAKEADKKSPTFDVTEFTLGDNLPELLKGVTITEISLENIDYRQHDNLLVNNLHLFTRHMVIDEIPAFAKERFMHAEQFEVLMDSVHYKASDNSMKVAFRDYNMTVDAGVGRISMDNINTTLQGDMDAEAKIDKFLITGIDTRELDEKIFAVDSIAMVYPRLAANINMNGDAEDGETDAEMDLYPAIEDLLKEVQINTIAIIDADLRVAGMAGNSRTAHIPHLDLTVSDVLIAEGTAFKDDRIMHTKDISLEMENIDFPLPDNIHFVRLRRFDMSTGDGYLVTEGLRFDHRGEAARHLDDPEVDQVYTVTNRRFAINNMNYGSLIREVGFYAGSISMDGLDVEVFGEPLITEEEAEEAAKEAEEELKFKIDKFTLAENLPDGLGAVYIGNLSLKDINIFQEDFIKVGGLEFNARQMAIDNRPAFKEDRFIHSKRFRIAIDTVHYIEPNEMILLSVKDFDFDISEGTGDFRIDRFTAKHEERVEGELYIDATINDFLIKGIDTREFVDRKFSIDEIIVSNPQLRADLGEDMLDEGEAEQEAEQAGEGMDPDLYPAIEEFLDEVHIMRIAVNDAEIKLLEPAGDLDIGRLPELNLEINDLLIAEGTAFKNDRVMHAKDIALQMNDIEIPLPDDVHTVSLDHFEMSTGEGTLLMSGLFYDFNDNYRKVMEGPETNMVFQVRNELFEIEGMDFSTILNEIDNIEELGVLLDRITVDGLSIKVLVDNNYPAEETEDDLPPTLQQMIKDIEMPFYLGDLSLRNGHVEYEELAEGADQSGIMTLDNLFVNVDKLTNIDSIIGNDLMTLINVDVMLMGDGHLRTKLAIPMHDVAQPVRFSGDLDSLDVTTLNRYTEYTTLFGFESGMIYTMRWDFDADTELSEGIFGLSYEDLVVRLSESDSPEPAGFLWQVGAYLANALVIDTDISEHKSDPPKKVDFDRIKEEEESFVEHYLSSIIAGLLEIKGFPLDIIDP